MNQEQIYNLIKQGNFEEALKALFENIEANPKEVENYINAGILLAEANEVDKAEKFFQRAITLDRKMAQSIIISGMYITMKAVLMKRLNCINKR